MQEAAFIPNIRMRAEDFWREVKHLSQDEKADMILMYMNHMLKKAKEAGVSVHRKNFVDQGERIRLFETVWMIGLARVNEFGRFYECEIEHYIVSSGNYEIIEGCVNILSI